MKRKNTYLLSLMLACCLVFLSCNEDSRSEDVVDKVELDMNIYDGSHLFDDMPEDPNAGFEYKIKTLRIFVFKSGTLESKIGYIEDENGDDITWVEDTEANEKYYSATLVLEKGYKTICMIANEPPAMTNTLNDIKKLDALNALLLDADLDAYNKSNPEYLCFTKTKNNVYVGIAENVESFLLLRTVGKLAVEIKRSEENNRTVEVKSAKLLNIATKTRLMEDHPLPLAERDETTKSVTLTTTSVTQDYADIFKPLYLFENYWGKGTLQAAIDGKSPALELKLQLRKEDGEPAIDGTFTLPLIMDVDENTKDLVYGVARNTSAKMSLRVTALTIEVEFTVVDEWDDEYYDRDPDTGNSNVNPDEDWDEDGADHEEYVPKLIKVTYSFTSWEGSVNLNYIEVRKGDMLYVFKYDNQWNDSDIYFEMH